jgi:hypothetical protein
MHATNVMFLLPSGRVGPRDGTTLILLKETLVDVTKTRVSGVAEIHGRFWPALQLFWPAVILVRTNSHGREEAGPRRPAGPVELSSIRNVPDG